MRLRLAICCALFGFCSVLCAGDVPLYYNVETGNVTIDTTDIPGGVFSGYTWDIPFRGFAANNWTPFMKTFYTTASDDILGESNFAGISPGVYSLGNVLTPGLSEQEFSQYFAKTEALAHKTGYANYAVGALGTGAQFSPQYAPSPFVALNDSSVGPTDVDRWATDVRLEYTPSTGGLALDTSGEEGGSILMYSVTLRGGTFDTDAFRPITQSDAASVVTSRETQLAEMSFADPISGDYYDLGKVLPVGLDQDQLTDIVSVANFLGEPSHGSSPLDLGVHGIEMSLTIVPEPESRSLLTLTLFASLLARRRLRTQQQG